MLKPLIITNQDLTYGIMTPNKKVACMTVVLSPRRDDYVDFLDIAKEAYATDKADIYRKIITTLIYALKKQLHQYEIENSELETIEFLTIAGDDLDLFYDEMYEAIDQIKLLKAHLDDVKEKEGLFMDLYATADKLHDALIHNLDIISTQEVRELQQTQAKAS